jgi:hypothetical protein
VKNQNPDGGYVVVNCNVVINASRIIKSKCCKYRLLLQH